VAALTEGPARLFGLYPKKGSLQTGTDADLVVWDPAVTRRIQAEKLETASDWNPYAGRVLQGLARHVFLRGIEVASQGKCLRRPVRGKYVLRRR
jgi:dihydropyrimidinase